MRILLVIIYILINSLFVFKYSARWGNYEYLFSVAYIIVVALLFYVIRLLSSYNRIKEQYAKYLFWVFFIVTCCLIFFLLYNIDPMNVRVDRWSATTYFLDALFQGTYPYGVHTHVSETNYPSPFPVWHIINIPFWLLGDVGLGLIFFLSLTLFSVFSFSNSYWKTCLFLFLLICSPAYWWEIVVRSDGLSNSLLVFCCILWLQKRNITFQNHEILMIIVCGMIASTRLSAIIPMALYLFRSYMQLSWLEKIYIPLGILGVIICTFIPFIFWDTQEWIFFQRNPFMSQTSVGNNTILLVMVIIGAIVAYYIKNINQFMVSAAIFLFVFMATSIVSLIDNIPIMEFLENSKCDISYFTLTLPYCIYAIIPFYFSKCIYLEPQKTVEWAHRVNKK